MQWFRAALAALLVGAGLARESPPATAQASQAAARATQQPAQPPTFRAGTSFVWVDAYPTLDGAIVTGLTRDDFEVLEEGVPQRIETFEHVVARAPDPGARRPDPRGLDATRDAAGDPRTRLFVVYFDTLHTVGFEDASAGITYDPRTAGRAVATFLEQVIGPDDLVALVRPDMPMVDLPFTRRPSSFEAFLSSGGEWQGRFVQGEADAIERMYKACYGDHDPAPAMIARRRELLMLDGLRGLVTHLQGMREGRKAVIVISEGWTLFRPDSSLARPIRGVPGVPRTPAPAPLDKTAETSGAPMWEECERHRLALASIDNDSRFRETLQMANRANVTFYALDPQGLPAEQRRARYEALRTLASATDGIAVVNSNDFTPGLRRIRDDLSSYYLLGYNATNAKPDGRFRRISVKVKRPGVVVRARPGYMALTAEEAALRSRAEAPRDPETVAREAALASLGNERADRPLLVWAGNAFEQSAGGSASGQVIWVVGEIEASVAGKPEWSGGAEARAVFTRTGGGTPSAERATINRGTPWFSFRLRDAAPGDYSVRVSLRAIDGAAEELVAQARATVPDSSRLPEPATGQPLLMRRGPSPNRPFRPTADRRFRRVEGLRIDLPLAGIPDAASGELLDRTGRRLPVPLEAAVREDGPGGQRLAAVEVPLAPLAPGDYLVRVAVKKGDRAANALAAFRIIP